MKYGIIRVDRRLIAAFASGLLALAAVLSLPFIPTGAPVSDSASCDEVGVYSTKAETASEQRRFLSRFGLSVKNSPDKVDEVAVPKSFDNVYADYNRLQNKIGLDLSPYRGRTVTRVVYKAGKRKNATLLIYRGRVIGGHIFSGIYGDAYRSLAG